MAALCNGSSQRAAINVVGGPESELHAFKMLFYAESLGGHFRSRDKDGGHTIRSAIPENPLLYANFMSLSFIESELLLIEVSHCVNREFRVLLRKTMYDIKFSISTAKLR